MREAEEDADDEVTPLVKALVEAWNMVPIGTPVTVIRDNGERLETHTRSEAWIVCGSPVIKVDGITGGFLLTRVSPR